MGTKYGVVTNPDELLVEDDARQKVGQETAPALRRAQVVAKPPRCPKCRSLLSGEFDQETWQGSLLCPNCGSAPFER
jgi:hypothetical protein